MEGYQAAGSSAGCSRPAMKLSCTGPLPPCCVSCLQEVSAYLLLLMQAFCRVPSEWMRGQRHAEE